MKVYLLSEELVFQYETHVESGVFLSVNFTFDKHFSGVWIDFEQVMWFQIHTLSTDFELCFCHVLYLVIMHLESKHTQLSSYCLHVGAGQERAATLFVNLIYKKKSSPVK